MPATMPQLMPEWTFKYATASAAVEVVCSDGGSFPASVRYDWRDERRGPIGFVELLLFRPKSDGRDRDDFTFRLSNGLSSPSPADWSVDASCIVGGSPDGSSRRSPAELLEVGKPKLFVDDRYVDSAGSDSSVVEVNGYPKLLVDDLYVDNVGSDSVVIGDIGKFELRVDDR